MAEQQMHLKRIFRKVDEEVDLAKQHAIAVFHSALSEELVQKELAGHKLELSRVLGFSKNRKQPNLRRAVAENFVNVLFDRKIVQNGKTGGVEEALIVEALLANGHKIRMVATGSRFTLGIYDALGNMTEEIRQQGPILELLKGARAQYT